jgi:hypothetical protein
LLLFFFLSTKCFDWEKEREKETYMHSWLLIIYSLYVVWGFKNDFTSSQKEIKPEREIKNSTLIKIGQKSRRKKQQGRLWSNIWSYVHKKLIASVYEYKSPRILSWLMDTILHIDLIEIEEAHSFSSLSLSFKYMDYLLMLFLLLFFPFFFSFSFSMSFHFPFTWVIECRLEKETLYLYLWFYHTPFNLSTRLYF